MVIIVMFTDPSGSQPFAGKQDVLRTLRAELGGDQIVLRVVSPPRVLCHHLCSPPLHESSYKYVPSRAGRARSSEPLGADRSSTGTFGADRSSSEVLGSARRLPRDSELQCGHGAYSQPRRLQVCKRYVILEELKRPNRQTDFNK